MRFDIFMFPERESEWRILWKKFMLFNGHRQEIQRHWQMRLERELQMRERKRK